MKTYPIVAAICLSLLAVSEADAKGKGKGGMSPEQKQKEAEKKKQREERSNKQAAVKKVLDEKDKNNDGSLSKDEYLAGEANAEEAGKKFDEHNKNGDRNLSKSEIADLLGL